MKKLTSIALILLAVGCGPMRGTLIDPATKINPKAVDYPVDVVTGEPSKPYKDIAILNVDRTAMTVFGSVKPEQVVEDLKVQAREMGCDGIRDIKIESYYSMSLNFTPTIPAKRGTATGFIYTSCGQ